MAGGSFPSEDAATGYQRAADRLEKAGVDVTVPPAKDVYFRPQGLAAGDTEAEYMSGTDAVVSYANDSELYPAALSHEFIHYTQVQRAIGEAGLAFEDALSELRNTVDEARSVLGEETVSAEILDGEHLATNSDVNRASVLYALENDLANVYDDSAEHDALLDAVRSDPSYDEKRREAVMNPIMRRAEKVEALPLDSYGEASALFWTLYEWCRRLTDDVAASDLYRDLHGWDAKDDADTPPRADIAAQLSHYDGEQHNHSTALLDGIEQRIQLYDQYRGSGMSGDAAVGRIINQDFDSFSHAGRRIREAERGG